MRAGFTETEVRIQVPHFSSSVNWGSCMDSLKLRVFLSKSRNDFGLRRRVDELRQ